MKPGIKKSEINHPNLCILLSNQTTQSNSTAFSSERPGQQFHHTTKASASMESEANHWKELEILVKEPLGILGIYWKLFLGILDIDTTEQYPKRHWGSIELLER
jgi:hypothetical protein